MDGRGIEEGTVAQSGVTQIVRHVTEEYSVPFALFDVPGQLRPTIPLRAWTPTNVFAGKFPSDTQTHGAAQTMLSKSYHNLIRTYCMDLDEVRRESHPPSV